MGRIQSSIGIITGVPIQDTVNQLIALSARPRDLLAARTDVLRSQQVAVTELTALVIGIQLQTDTLGQPQLFERTEISSSNEESIAARVDGSPAPGTYSFTPVQLAQSHQLLSSGLSTTDKPLGEGELTLKFGGLVDDGVLLENLNQGQGIQRGRIRVTDRSGTAGIIDLRFVQTVDDVLEAINFNGVVDVTASVEGDSLVLTDQSGQAVTNLRVQDIGQSTTAADLGLAGIDTDQDSVVGQDVLSLHDGLRLSLINDGSGVSLRRELADLEVSFQDGSTPLLIDLDPPPQASGTTTAVAGVNGQVTFTAVQGGSQYDDVTILFVDDGTVTKGNETVVYDESDPGNKTLTFSIEEGQTTSGDIVSALENSPLVAQLFTASLAPDSTGNGVIDLTDTGVTAGGSERTPLSQRTLGEIVDILNAADPARLQASISADGDRLELQDLTAGGGAFSIQSVLGGTTAEDLGLDAAAAGGTLTTRRLIGGLKSSLLSSLNGGRGLGTLGSITLTDRSGAAATVDLSGAETLDDVLRLIGQAPVAIQARINEARNGLELKDVSGQTSGNLIVASADATGTAELLGIDGDLAENQINSGTLNLQTYSEQLRLDQLRNGEGIQQSSFVITDSAGGVGAINLAVSDIETVGELIGEINGLSIGVTARINDTGDGLRLVDTAGGNGTLNVAEGGNGSTAAQLKILGDATLIDVGGVSTQVIDGPNTVTITVDAEDSLEDLVEKINDLDAGVAASIFNTGGGVTPFRLSLVSQVSGLAGRLQVDTSQLSFSVQEVVAAQDALLLVGSPDSLGAGVLATSNSNQVESVIEGVTLDLLTASTNPVTISVTSTDQPLLDGAELFVNQFNLLRDKIEELTFFDEESSSTGLLFGSGEILRIESSLSNLISGRIAGAGPIQTLAEVGIRIGEEGRLSLDQEKFTEAYARDPEAVQQFFTAEDFGVSARFSSAIDNLAGEENSVLLNRQVTLQTNIESNVERLDFLDARLETEREALLLQFFNMESAIAKLQSGLQSLQAIQPIAPL